MATAKKKVTKRAIKNPLGVKFETGIEIPSNRAGLGADVRKTLSMMMPGESFLFEYDSISHDKSFQSFISQVAQQERKYESGKTFCTRKVEGGRRVWRLS